MDAKLRYKAKKIKIIFFDIDDTLRNSKTGFVPTTIQNNDDLVLYLSKKFE